MRRHGWAFCFGLFLSSAAAAQPPADEERFPPPPDLPGEVVSQLPSPRPAAKVTQKDVKLDAPAPLPDITPTPYSGTVKANVTPVDPLMTAGPTAGCNQPASCPVPTGHSGCCISLSDLKEWALFRSQARQSGPYVPPYRPPLQAWFPCDPRSSSCGAGLHAKAGCATCASGMPLPAAVAGAPVNSATKVDAPPAATEPALLGGNPVGKCADSDVLTSFQPVNPGLGFAPGGAPMANPTTQVKASTWKPR
ncbi:MAG TPA: hypothetical protein VHR66_28205 [Gemmataceae bacterium]|jgi:hypothetical protein|nr:hypothetical protein [Gemmataceae bacterium]